jgi:hypothetical protein
LAHDQDFDTPPAIAQPIEFTRSVLFAGRRPGAGDIQDTHGLGSPGCTGSCELKGTLHRDEHLIKATLSQERDSEVEMGLSPFGPRVEGGPVQGLCLPSGRQALGIVAPGERAQEQSSQMECCSGPSAVDGEDSAQLLCGPCGLARRRQRHTQNLARSGRVVLGESFVQEWNGLHTTTRFHEFQARASSLQVGSTAFIELHSTLLNEQAEAAYNDQQAGNESASDLSGSQ